MRLPPDELPFDAPNPLPLPLGPEEAANFVEQQALSALGATSAVVVTLGPFPVTASAGYPHPTLHVVHAVGLPADVAAALEQLPLDAPVPLAEVARHGKPLFLPSEIELRRYPDWSVAVEAAGVRSAAIVPVWANGELRGVLGLTWAAPRVFDEDERAFVLTRGVMCAQSIMRAHLRAAEQRAREGERTSRATAEQANRSKAHFVTTISHELRTPINSVMGYAELLANSVYGPVSELQKDPLARMRASGTHLLGLIEELLSFARIEAGEETVRPESIRLADIVDQSVSLVQPIARTKGLRIRVVGLDPSVDLYADPRKLRQILVNVLANAVKFTTAGEVVLLLRLDGQAAAVTMYYEVTDTGRGMALEDHERIFDPFWQQDPTTSHSAGSTFVVAIPARFVAPADAAVQITP